MFERIDAPKSPVIAGGFDARTHSTIRKRIQNSRKRPPLHPFPIPCPEYGKGPGRPQGIEVLKNDLYCHADPGSTGGASRGLYGGPGFCDFFKIRGVLDPRPAHWPAASSTHASTHWPAHCPAPVRPDGRPTPLPSIRPTGRNEDRSRTPSLPGESPLSLSLHHPYKDLQTATMD